MLHRAFAASAFILAAGSIGALAQSGTQDMYGISYFPATLHRINAITGTSTLINGISLNGANSLTADANGRLYTTEHVSGRLLRIEPSSGAATVIGANADLNDTRGLAISPGGDGYAVTSPTGSGNPQFLHQINLTTGATLSTVALGTRWHQGMDFSPLGDLYVWDMIFGLGRINLTTGAFTDVNPAHNGPGMQSVSFRNDGALYASDEQRLYTVNPATGQETVVGAYGAVTDMRGIEFVPEPASAALLVALAAGALHRRRV